MIEFKTEGMTCQSCIRHVTGAVKSVDPDATVTVNLKDQTISIQSDEDQPVLAKAIEAAGYPIHQN